MNTRHEVMQAVVPKLTEKLSYDEWETLIKESLLLLEDLCIEDPQDVLLLEDMAFLQTMLRHKYVDSFGAIEVPLDEL